MNTQDSDVQVGKTGSLDKTEAPSNLAANKATGGLVLVTEILDDRLSDTGRLDELIAESLELTDDQDASLAASEQPPENKLESIFFEEDETKFRDHIMRECEAVFNNGLITGQDELDILNHVFSHLQNGIVIALLEDLPPAEITQKYFEKVKIIVQTYVEYLHLVKGIEWYKLKSFIANFSIYLREVYEDEKGNNLTLKTLNTFLPELISSLKDKKNLLPFTNSLIGVIIFLNQSKDKTFPMIINDWEFSLAMDEFIAKYLNCDRKFFTQTLLRIHNSVGLPNSPFNLNNVKEGSREAQGFEMIRRLNDPDLIGNDMDYFINDIARTIRLKAIPSSAKLIFGNTKGGEAVSNMEREIRLLHADSRRSVYLTREVAISSRETRKVLDPLPPFYTKQFLSKFNLQLSNIWEFPKERAESRNTPQIFKRLYNKDPTIEILEPVALIQFFLSVFESSIIYIDEWLSQMEDKTISDETISTLLLIKFREFRELFEEHAKKPLRELEVLEYYFLMSLGKSQTEIADYVIPYVNENDDRDKRHVFDLVRIVNEYVAGLRKKLSAKNAIKYTQNERTDRDVIYEHYILETLTSAVRTDYVYYVDTVEQFFTECIKDSTKDGDVLQIVMHTLSHLAQNAPTRFMKLNAGEIKNLDVKAMALIFVKILEKNKRLELATRKLLGIRGDFDLTFFVVNYLISPHTLNFEREA